MIAGMECRSKLKDANLDLEASCDCRMALTAAEAAVAAARADSATRYDSLADSTLSLLEKCV